MIILRIFSIGFSFIIKLFLSLSKPCQMLRDLGFQFQKDKKNNELSTLYLCYQDGVEGRKITDYYKNHSADQGKIKLFSKREKIVSFEVSRLFNRS